MNNGISKITYAHDITLVTLSALPCDSKAIANVLTAMSDADVNVDMISQTAPQGGTIRLSFSLSDSALSSALAVLGKIRGENPEVKPEILPGNCKVALYDANMVNTPASPGQGLHPAGRGRHPGHPGHHLRGRHLPAGVRARPAGCAGDHAGSLWGRTYPGRILTTKSSLTHYKAVLPNW